MILLIARLVLLAVGCSPTMSLAADAFADLRRDARRHDWNCTAFTSELNALTRDLYRPELGSYAGKKETWRAFERVRIFGCGPGPWQRSLELAKTSAPANDAGSGPLDDKFASLFWDTSRCNSELAAYTFLTRFLRSTKQMQWSEEERAQIGNFLLSAFQERSELPDLSLGTFNRINLLELAIDNAIIAATPAQAKRAHDLRQQSDEVVTKLRKAEKGTPEVPLGTGGYDKLPPAKKVLVRKYLNHDLEQTEALRRPFAALVKELKP